MERVSSCGAAQRAVGRTTVPFTRRQPRRCIAASALEGRPNRQAFLSGLPTMGGATDPQQQQPQTQPPQNVAQSLTDAAPAAAAPSSAATPAAAGVSVASPASPTPPSPAAAEEPTPPSWESWCSHFEAQDAAGTQLDVLQDHLQGAVRREDYTTAAQLQQQLQELSDTDAVAALRQQLSTALLNEDYATAQAVAEQGATWLEGWWVGRSETAAVGMGGYEGPHPDPLGHLLHVTAEYGRWTGRVYTPRDLAEVSGWVDDSNTQVLLKFGRTAASAMPGPAARRMRPGGPSTRGPAPSSDLPSLQSVGCPVMELFVKEAPAAPSSSRDAAAGAEDAVGTYQQQAVLLQSKQDLKQMAAEAAPRALVQQLARGTDPEAGGRSGRKQRRAGAVTFWFDFGQQGEPGEVQVVEVGMMVQQLGVYKRTVVLPPPQVQRIMEYPDRAASPIPFGSDDSNSDAPAASSSGSRAEAGAGTTSSSSSSDAAVSDNPSLRHLSSFELREVLETLQQLKGDGDSSSSSSSTTPEEGGWVLAGPSELSSSSSRPAGTTAFPTTSSSSEEQQAPTPVPRLYGQRSNGDSGASSSDYMNGLARSSDDDSTVLPSGMVSNSSSSSGAEARRGGLAGLFRQAGAGLEEEEGPEGVDLQRLPAGITRLGKDTFVLEESPATVPPLASLTSPLSGIWASSSSSGSGRAPVSPESRYSSVGLGDDPSVPRCVVLTLPVTHAAALAAAKEVSWGSTGILGTTSGTSSTSGRSLEEELAARLGEVEPTPAGGEAAGSSSSATDGEGILSGSSRGQLARELAGERAVWERAARDVVARQVELTGRPLPPQCVAQMAGVLQLHAETLAAAGLVVSPGAPAEVSDVPADYTPEPARLSYQRLPVNQPRTDPFTGLYLGAFGPHGQELLQLQRQVDEDGDEEVVGIKLTGDVNVPAGVVSFRAKVGRRHRLNLKEGGYPEELGVTARYPGQGRVAQSGFRSPQWVEGELVVFSSRSAASWVIGDAPLGFLWAVPGERRYLILLHRIQLEDLV